MLNEIINVYQKQLDLYKSLNEILEQVQKKDFDLISYNVDFENADYLLNQIEKLNIQAEQLKLIYVQKNHINDFTGEELKKIEKPEEYAKIKNVIDNITKIISSVKRTQDMVINKINKENNFNKKNNIGNNKQSIVEIYKKNVD